MSDKLNTLLECLKAHQRTLNLVIAKHDRLPPRNLLRQVAELGNFTASVEAVAAEESYRLGGTAGANRPLVRGE